MNYAIILAAGSGARMNMKTNKAIIGINKKPMFLYSVDLFVKHKLINKTVLVVSKQDLNLAKNKCKNIKNLLIVQGGDTRNESLLLGMKTLPLKSTDIVVSHDAARIFINNQMITNVIQTANKNNFSTMASNCIDTVVDIKTNKIINRDNIKQIHTPQACKQSFFTKCKKNKNGSDLLSFLNCKIRNENLVLDNQWNFKITHQEDLFRAEQILKN